MHPIFHVSQLKLKVGRSITLLIHLPPVNPISVVQVEPEEVLDKRSRKIHNKVVVELLVRWQGQTSAKATWEVFHQLKTSYPHLVGKVF
jgi:hypothetical protein